MDKQTLLTNCISNLELDLITANYNQCDADWQDMNYTPDYSKLYFICGGEGWLKIGDQEYYPVPGELILMPEGVNQSYSTTGGEPFYKYWCHFSAKVGDINLFQILELSHMCSTVDSGLVREIFSSMVSYAKSDEMHASLLAKSKLLELFAYYLSRLKLEDITLKHSASSQKLSGILAFIEANIEHNITVQELAERVYMHPNYFIRLFKQHMGVPPIQYITRKKIEKAKELLANTPGTVSEVSRKLGFSDLFYFSKQFKKHVGLTPTEYRKTNRL